MGTLHYPVVMWADVEAVGVFIEISFIARFTNCDFCSEAFQNLVVFPLDKGNSYLLYCV